MSFGIDFGTTNSAIVFDQVNLIAIVPTAIAFDPITQQFAFGTEVREQHAQLLDGGWTVITSLKTCLDDENMTWRLGGRVETPQTLITCFFEHLIDEAARLRPADTLEDAVVSIPVGFPAAKRRVLRQAAEDAGLRVVDFVSESTAAVLHARRDLAGMQRVAVFDWGGGTLDVSVLSLTGGKVRELAVGSLTRAGDEIDRLIAEWAYEQFKPTLPDAPAEMAHLPPIDRDRLLVVCETAKQQLSDDLQAGIALPRFLGSIVHTTLDRDRLRSLIRPLLDEAFDTLDATLAAAGLSPRDIDAIVPIGGTSGLVALQEEMGERYGHHKVRDLDEPRWVVAQGASILNERVATHPAGSAARLDQTLSTPPRRRHRPAPGPAGRRLRRTAQHTSPRHRRGDRFCAARFYRVARHRHRPVPHRRLPHRADAGLPPRTPRARHLPHPRPHLRRHSPQSERQPSRHPRVHL